MTKHSRESLHSRKKQLQRVIQIHAFRRPATYPDHAHLIFFLILFSRCPYYLGKAAHLYCVFHSLILVKLESAKIIVYFKVAHRSGTETFFLSTDI